MPCRCGQNCAKRSCGSAQARPGTSASTAGASSTSTPPCAGSTSASDVPGLGQVRRAGDVGDHAAGAGGLQGRGQQAPLQAAQVGDGLRGTPPAGLGAAAQGAEPGARDVGDDPVEGARRPGRPRPVGHHHAGRAPPAPAVAARPWRSGCGGAHQPGPVRAYLGRDQPGALLRGQAAEQAGLAARAAQVQPPVVAAGHPAAVTSPLRTPPLCTRVSAMAASWLASSWTPARPCADGRDPGRVALGQVGAELRPPGRGRAGRGQLGGPGQAGDRAQGNRGALAVGGQRGLGLGQRAAERLTQRGDDPPGVAVPDGQVALEVVGASRGRDLEPGLQVAARDAAQDGVDESGRPRADHVPDQVDGGGHGGVRGDPGAQQLMGAEPEDLAHGGLQGVQLAVAAHGEHGVIGAPAAQRAVGELGGQRGVPAAEPALGQRGREQQVGVGVPLGHGAQHVAGGPAGRIGAAAPWRALADDCGRVPPVLPPEGRPPLPRAGA